MQSESKIFDGLMVTIIHGMTNGGMHMHANFEMSMNNFKFTFNINFITDKLFEQLFMINDEHIDDTVAHIKDQLDHIIISSMLGDVEAKIFIPRDTHYEIIHWISSIIIDNYSDPEDRLITK